MPADERHERCDRHPGSVAVARCAGCGRPMCLACATPVRGDAYGAECLGTVLGTEVGAATDGQTGAPDARARWLARLGFALAFAATILPWSRFGPGSEAFGAWSRAGRWSVVAGIAAVLGLALTLIQRSGRMRSTNVDLVVAVLGAAVAIGAMLAVAYPPAFSRPWLGPWVTAAAGILACGATVVAARASAPAPVRI